MEIIRSSNNKMVKYINSLKLKKTRQKENLFIAEGERLVNDAIKKKTPEFIVISENYKSDINCDNIYTVSEDVFKKISDTMTPQGILAVFKTDIKKINDIKIENTLILNRVSDPGNMGTMLRTAVATGFKNIIIDKECCDIYNPKTIRSSMSAVFDLDIYISDDLSKDIVSLKNKSFDIYSAVLNRNSTNLYDTDFKNPTGIIIGNEANGVDDEVIKSAGKSVFIPMEGNIESLNAAVAGSVIMYEILRRNLK